LLKLDKVIAQIKALKSLSQKLLATYNNYASLVLE